MKNFSNNYPIHGTSVLAPRCEIRQGDNYSRNGRIVKFPSSVETGYNAHSSRQYGNRVSSYRNTADIEPARNQAYSFDREMSRQSAHSNREVKRPYTANADYSKTEAFVFSAIGIAVSFFFVLI